MLTAGLLMGAGGAVAVADPISIGPDAQGDDGITNALSPGSITANNPVADVADNVSDTVQKTVPRATSTLGSGRQPGQQPSTGAASSNSKPGGTDTKDETNSSAQVTGTLDSRPVVAVPNPVAAIPNVDAPVADVVAPVPRVVAPVPRVVAPVPRVVAPIPKVVAPVVDVVAPVPSVVAPVTDVVAPVVDVVAPVTDVVAPVSDVVDMVAGMPGSVASAAAPLGQQPSDLTSFLLGVAGVAPVGDGMGGTGVGPGFATGALATSQLPLVPPVGSIPGVPSAGDASGFATLLLPTSEPTGVNRASSPAAMAPLEPGGGILRGLHSFFRDIYAKLLLPVSLWALFTVALPGIAGLAVLTAIGARVGYRQAKAGFAVRAAGITRLARPGQLGVGRSGALSAESLLNRVA